MELEKQVCSLDFAKRLKELRVKQGSLFKWMKDSSGQYFVRFESGVGTIHPYQYSAFTVSELGEMIPERIRHEEFGYGFVELPHHDSPLGYRGWIKWVRGVIWCIQPNDNEPCLKSEADARAKMLLYLIEKELISAP